MKETGIIFSTELIPKILDGTLTQARRVMKPQPHIEKGVMRWDKWKNAKRFISINMDDHADLAVPYCPYGQVGDRLWVRESFFTQEKVWVGDHYVPDGRTFNSSLLHCPIGIT